VYRPAPSASWRAGLERDGQRVERTPRHATQRAAWEDAQQGGHTMMRRGLAVVLFLGWQSAIILPAAFLKATGSPLSRARCNS